MKSIVSDVIITTDSCILYYGKKDNYEKKNWKEITGIVTANDLEDPTEADTLNTMYFLAKRKKKSFFVDPLFFKKFKDVN